MRACLRPLSPQEQQVAEQNHHLVFAFLRAYNLPPAEYYGIVVFRYLLTVQRWFRNPELYRYEFSTIAWAAMRSAVNSEQRKQKRRIQTISLDAVIAGTEGLTLADLITDENLDYIPYITEAS